MQIDTKFKASNGWLDSFNIKQMTGECANVQEETVSEWYIWSTDETGCFSDKD